MSELTTPVMSEQDAHRITERIRYTAMIVRDNVAKLQELVAQAQDGHAHEALGYPSWTAYIADVFSDAPMKLERAQRREVVAWLSGEGMSTRAIAPIVGTSHMTVKRDADAGVTNVTPAPRPAESDLMAGGEWTPDEDDPVKVQQRLDDAYDADWSTPPFDPATGELVDANPGHVVKLTGPNSVSSPGHIVGLDGKQYTRPEPTKPRRAPLTDSFWRATYDLTKKIESIERLVDDDRFPQNAEKVATANRSDLLRAIDALQRIVNRLNENPTN